MGSAKKTNHEVPLYKVKGGGRSNNFLVAPRPLNARPSKWESKFEKVTQLILMNEVPKNGKNWSPATDFSLGLNTQKTHLLEANTR